MFFRYFYDHQLAQASYLVGCPASGEALVVEPNRNIDQYLRTADVEGLRVTHVTETHIHADFVSGARELAHRAGAWQGVPRHRLSEITSGRLFHALSSRFRLAAAAF